MNKPLPTIVVKGNNGQPLIINESDYDPRQYELFDNKKDSVADKETLKAFLNEKGVDYPKNISEKKLMKLYEDTLSNTLSVVEKNGKFTIVNGKDEKIGDDSYATAEEAELMLKMFTGK